MKGAVELASQISKKSPVAMTGIKHNLNYSRDHSAKEGLEYLVGLLVKNFSKLQGICSLRKPIFLHCYKDVSLQQVLVRWVSTKHDSYNKLDIATSHFWYQQTAQQDIWPVGIIV